MTYERLKSYTDKLIEIWGNTIANELWELSDEEYAKVPIVEVTEDHKRYIETHGWLFGVMRNGEHETIYSIPPYFFRIKIKPNNNG